jgi:hypothetical protein
MNGANEEGPARIAHRAPFVRIILTRVLALGAGLLSTGRGTSQQHIEDNSGNYQYLDNNRHKYPGWLNQDRVHRSPDYWEWQG